MIENPDFGTCYESGDVSGYCKKCGKPFVYVGDVPIGGYIPYCTCNIEKSKSTLYGWTCPLCGRVYSPFVKECLWHKINIDLFPLTDNQGYSR